MALWTINPTQGHDVYTVVYFLRDALSSALDDAGFFESTALPKAEVKGADHAELSARLGRFRTRCMAFQEREALMVTKLLRARIWASELRRLCPEIQRDADQFLEATERCEEMQAEFVNDPQRMFHGGALLSRFLAQRRPEALSSAQDGGDRLPSDGSYRVGGHTALFELRVACEVFLNQIDCEFFSSNDIGTSDLTAPLATYLEASDEVTVHPQPPEAMP